MVHAQLVEQIVGFVKAGAAIPIDIEGGEHELLEEFTHWPLVGSLLIELHDNATLRAAGYTMDDTEARIRNRMHGKPVVITTVTKGNYTNLDTIAYYVEPAKQERPKTVWPEADAAVVQELATLALDDLMASVEAELGEICRLKGGTADEALAWISEREGGTLQGLKTALGGENAAKLEAWIRATLAPRVSAVLRDLLAHEAEAEKAKVGEPAAAESGTGQVPF
jgi:hypothetical protein